MARDQPAHRAENPLKALFFAEGGPGIGLGHLRRCAALADGLTRRGWDCRFLALEPAVVSWLSERGKTLEPVSPPQAGRLPDADYACDVLVVDSYPAANEDIAAKARGKSRLVLAFDDHMNRHGAADVILNTGVFAPSQAWPGRVERLLGPAYHPLPSDYLPLPSRRDIPATVSRVLVTLGGAGKAALLERVVEAVRAALPGAAIDAVVGPFAEEPAGLEGNPAVTLHRSPASLKGLMLACDLAVAASGQTLAELAATGTPAVAFCLAENQRENLLGMQEAGAVLSAGSVDDAGFESALVETLGRAAGSGARRSLSEKGRVLVDGEGASRVEHALAGLLARKTLEHGA